jgi:ABC-2 type transport system ATP-binding protein
VRRLDDLQIALSDIGLHKPTLDDVFLSLTGHAAADGTEPERNAGKKKKKGRRGGGKS